MCSRAISAVVTACPFFCAASAAWAASQDELLFVLQLLVMNRIFAIIFLLIAIFLYEEAQCKIRHDEEGEDRQFKADKSSKENGVDRFLANVEAVSEQAAYLLAPAKKK
jgi:hypothetical protein